MKESKKTQHTFKEIPRGGLVNIEAFHGIAMMIGNCVFRLKNPNISIRVKYNLDYCEGKYLVVWPQVKTKKRPGKVLKMWSV
ncbi:hypothetical protein M8J75_000273 [Diaphorina citri]|nr:hypothetical protein M8J75_000273 [Diaphorina citri]